MKNESEKSSSSNLSSKDLPEDDVIQENIITVSSSESSMSHFSVSSTDTVMPADSAAPVGSVASVDSDSSGSNPSDSDSPSSLEISDVFVPVVSDEVLSEYPNDSDSSDLSGIPLSTQKAVEPTKIIIIGTAHVSEKSVKEVKETIEREKPDIVAVELCANRYKSIMEPEQNKEVSFKDILSPGQTFYYLLYGLLSYIQKKMGEELGVPPGTEMFAAIDGAQEIGADLALIDRDIQTTFKRFIAKMSFWEKVKMLYALVTGYLGIGGKEEMVEFSLDSMTDQDVVSALIEEFRKFSPTAASVLIDERDAYLAGSIVRTIKAAGPGKKIVVVIGAGHRQGVINYLHDPSTIPDLATLVTIPKKRFSLAKIISYTLIGLVLLAFLYIIYSVVTYPDMTPEILLIAFASWFLINGVLSAIGVLVAGGKPKSAFVAFMLAWFTSLNPLVAAGWFAGLTEAAIRKPTTNDLKRMMNAETFKEMNNNPFFKVILVAALANVGSIIGTLIGTYVVLQISGIDIVGIIKDVVSGIF
ncbi:hypothetical protein MsAg5_03430 [Methanosarcinaceae archaeon Ag5]|uniref:TraB family protein n=2 Tax=Methanolapillus africanus TaxID=3028297 RepID=A0AAE4MJ10_9EURY|nr:hypothetical protein [Methanosarcinaceae archaeon Ag5]